MNSVITPNTMKNASVLSSSTLSADNGTSTITIAASGSEAWVARKIIISTDTDDATKQTALPHLVTVTVLFDAGGTPKTVAIIHLHPDQDDTSDAGTFDCGPWTLDLSPGLTRSVKNEDLTVTVSTFGTNAKGSVTLLYQ